MLQQLCAQQRIISGIELLQGHVALLDEVHHDTSETVNALNSIWLQSSHNRMGELAMPSGVCLQYLWHVNIRCNIA